jgi:predicted transcriptional regulator
MANSYHVHVKRNTDTYRNFTTTLPDALLRELDQAAKELRVRKNFILIQAFSAWNRQRKKGGSNHGWEIS